MFATLPVTALRTFEAAARLRSFKLAANELSVTPTAVSHQVKALERHVGCALFDRVPRGVRLTDKGARLFAGVHGALLEVAQTLDALRPDVHCKGDDYRPPDGKPLPERAVIEAYGGRVEFLPLVPGRSTTELVERIGET